MPTVPFYVLVHGDRCGGLIEPTLFGAFRATSRWGVAGTFATVADAELALLAEPPFDRRKPAPRQKKQARPPPLTLPDRGGPVFHGGRKIGGWIRTADGFVAWTKQGKQGVYATPGLAGNAVVIAYLEAAARGVK